MTEKNTDEKKTVSENVSGFLTKYRLVFLGLIICLIVVAVVWGIFSSVSSSSHQKGLNQLDSIIYNLSKADEESVAAVKETSLPQILELAEKNKGNIVGLRANMAAAEIYFSEKKWSEARDSWLIAAQANEAVYTAPLCYYNAAVCSEELADLDAAIEYYGKALANDNCEFKPHILFSLGRVYEGKEDFTTASENYMELQNTYPSDSWTSIAESRLIALRVEGKIQ